MPNEYYAGIDIGGTKVSVSIADSGGVLVTLRQQTVLEGGSSAIPLQLEGLLNGCCERAGISRELINAAGISTCGPFLKDNGKTVLISPNLCGGLARERGMLPNEWTEIPLAAALSGEFKKLSIENDAVSAAIAEHRLGAGVNEPNMIYVTWSTGIGAGIIADGNVLRGKNGNAGHGGHIYCAEDGPQCGCGNFGDLEALASGTAIARDYGGGTDAAAVFDAFGKNDRRATDVIRRAARHFARGLASMNALLDTQVFIVGGSVYLNNRDILEPLVTDEFHRSFPALSESVRIVPPGLGERLADVAALALVLPDTLIARWHDKKPWLNMPEPETMK